MKQLSREDLLTHFQNTDFVRKTQAQIAKDFERLGHDVNPQLATTNFSLDPLIECVSEMLAEVLKKGEQTTLQLLYQIDVPQSQFLQLTTDPNFLFKASELIVRREAQKVYFRSIF